MGQFWAEALGYRLDLGGGGDDGAKLYPPETNTAAPTLLLQPSAGPKLVKNRNHPDVNVHGMGDVEAEVRRLEGFGARKVEVGQIGDEPFVVLADPEGNEFCVLRVAPNSSDTTPPRIGVEIDCVLLDVDGTLVDSNYQHVLAWQRALRSEGVTVPAWRVHRLIGMGGDQIVPSLTSQDFEDDRGDVVRAAWRQSFDEMLTEVAPIEGATELLRGLKNAGAAVALASSGARDHVEHYLDLLDARQIVDGWTTSDDVETTKPEPDLLAVARDRVGGSRPLTIGDSTWDCEAARRLGIPAMAVRTGGFSIDELLGAGATRVFDSLPALGRAILSAPIEEEPEQQLG